MTGIKEKTCCFSGHRRLPASKIQRIIFNLNQEIDRLIEVGVTTFISGGAVGFDQMAACLISSKKEMGYDLKLAMALPCREQDAAWNEKEKQLYRYLLEQADTIKYISDNYSNDCMKKRNQYMVSQSAFCICALLHNRSGTGQTVRLAHLANCRVINVAR